MSGLRLWLALLALDFRELTGLAVEELRDALFLAGLVLLIGTELGVVTEIAAVVLFNYCLRAIGVRRARQRG